LDHFGRLLGTQFGTYLGRFFGTQIVPKVVSEAPCPSSRLSVLVCVCLGLLRLSVCLSVCLSLSVGASGLAKAWGGNPPARLAFPRLSAAVRVGRQLPSCVCLGLWVRRGSPRFGESLFDALGRSHKLMRASRPLPRQVSKISSKRLHVSKVLGKGGLVLEPFLDPFWGSELDLFGAFSGPMLGRILDTFRDRFVPQIVSSGLLRLTLRSFFASAWRRWCSFAAARCHGSAAEEQRRAARCHIAAAETPRKRSGHATEFCTTFRWLERSEPASAAS
jgi:hypothetical protein